MTIYTDKSKAVAEFKKRFSNTPLLSFLCKYDEDTLYAKLLGNEQTVRDRLRILLEPTQVLTQDDSTDAALIPGLETAKTPYLLDPGYDYTADFFQANSWGYLVTRRKPIIAIQQFSFVYVDPKISLMDVPKSWLRIDRQYGHVRLLPTGEAALLPLNSYLLSVFGGGRTIPNMIHVRYTAGINDIRKDYPGLYEFMFRVAALELIQDTFPSGSSSVAADGLSESESFDITQWLDANKGIITNEFRRWQDIFQGPRIVFA